VPARPVRTVVLALAALLASEAGADAAANPPADPTPTSVTTLAVIGDTPYGTAKVAEFPRLVNRINADPDVSLVAHLGDIKSGSTVCSDAYFARIRALFDTFEEPVVYTPGDNEWTDCHRTNNGAYFPPERLDAVRRTFFPVPGQTLGATKRQVLTQASRPGFSPFVENTMWTQSQVVFATLDLPGSNNDHVPWTNVTPEQAAQQPAEYTERTRADLVWMFEAFVTAFRQNAKAVVLMVQADMWDTAEPDLSGYDTLVRPMAALAQAFGRPVLLLEGDSHVFRVDDPLTPADPLYPLHPVAGLNAPNFTRIVIEGSTNPTEYLRLTVDPNAPRVFTWQRVPV